MALRLSSRRQPADEIWFESLQSTAGGEADALFSESTEEDWLYEPKPHSRLRRLVGSALLLTLAGVTFGVALHEAQVEERRYERAHTTPVTEQTDKELAIGWVQQSMYPKLRQTHGRAPLRLTILEGTEAVMQQPNNDGGFSVRSIANFVAVRVPSGAIEIIGQNIALPEQVEVWDLGRDNVRLCQTSDSVQIKQVVLGHDNLRDGFADHSIGQISSSLPMSPTDAAAQCLKPLSVNVTQLNLKPAA